MDGEALRARSLGRLGEDVAADHLVRRGFAILQRNYRTRWGEIDIVAFDGRTLVFCEVKSRGSARAGGRPGPAAVAPLESLRPRKRAQVRRMATSWMNERFERPFAAELRFDAIGVTFDRRGALLGLEHLEGAF
ncbi:MAG: YraN family protein [Solirubrobacterales bacterium]|nr:YraN family protein [Solirubrobacterales bacterium]